MNLSTQKIENSLKISVSDSVLTSLPALLGFGLILFAVLFGPVVMLPGTLLQFPLNSVGFGSACVALFCLAAYRSRTYHHGYSQLNMATAGLFLTAVYCSSDLLLRPHGFAHHTFPLLFFLTVAIVAMFFRPSAIYLVALIATLLAGPFAFYSTIGTGLIFSDDHPSFLYRLIQLKQEFPNIPFYNPGWNGGIEAREFFPSGVLNLFLFFSPLIYLFDVTTIYTALVAATLFGIVPVAMYLAGRICDMNGRAALAASALAVCSSIFWYRWAFAYGTMGFVTSVALLPLNIALAARLLDESKPDRIGFGAIFGLTATLTLFWSPSALVLVPTALTALPTLWRQKKRRAVQLAVILILLLNIPWSVAFIKASNVGGFVAGPQADSAFHDKTKFKTEERLSEPPLKHALTELREGINPINPVTVFFGLLGLLTAFRGLTRRLYLAATCSAIILGTFGPILLPHLELDRMFVILALLLTLPAASLISQTQTFISATGEQTGLFRHRLQLACSIALFSLLPGWTWQVSSNQTHETYSAAPPEVFELVDKIRTCGPGGRVMIAGFTLHEFGATDLRTKEVGGGHVAPLPALTGRPIIANSYQHDRWQYSDVVPQEFRNKKDQGVTEFLNLLNVSCVVTHDRFWRNWYSDRPGHFTRLGESGGFQLFSRNGFTPNYFLQGNGEVIEQTGSNVLLRVESGEAVIKFRYLPFLRVDGCAEIAPFEAGPKTTLIKLSGCQPGQPVSIKAASILSRIF
jgi:MFS family permease